MLRVKFFRDAEFILEQNNTSQEDHQEIRREWLQKLSDTTNSGQKTLMNDARDFASATRSFASCTAQTSRILSAGICKLMERRNTNGTFPETQQEQWWRGLHFFSVAIDKARKPFENLLEKVQQEIETASLEELIILIQEWLDQLEQWWLNYAAMKGPPELVKPNIARLVTEPMIALKKAPSILAKSLESLQVLPAAEEEGRAPRLQEEAEFRKTVKLVVLDIME